MTTQAQIEGLGEFVNFGFTLEHPNDYVVVLMHEGELVARFSRLGTTEQSIQNECSLHLALKHGWDGCLWDRK